MKIKLLLMRALTKGICSLLLLMLFSFQSRGASGLLPSGYLHTKGAQIVDQNNNPVRICSVGWGWYGGTPRKEGLHSQEINKASAGPGGILNGFRLKEFPISVFLIRMLMELMYSSKAFGVSCQVNESNNYH